VDADSVPIAGLTHKGGGGKSLMRRGGPRKRGERESNLAKEEKALVAKRKMALRKLRVREGRWAPACRAEKKSMRRLRAFKGSGPRGGNVGGGGGP